MNFEDWLESKGCMDGYGTDYQDAYDEGFDEGQQSQQAKIDCMQVRLNGANERALSILNHKNRMVDKMQAEVDGLQGRIDGVVGLLETSFNPSKKNIIDILKGNKDEN